MHTKTRGAGVAWEEIFGKETATHAITLPTITITLAAQPLQVQTYLAFFTTKEISKCSVSVFTFDPDLSRYDLDSCILITARACTKFPPSMERVFGGEPKLVSVGERHGG